MPLQSPPPELVDVLSGLWIKPFNLDSDAERIFQYVELFNPDSGGADTAVLQAHGRNVFGQSLDEIDVITRYQSPHAIGQFLVANHIRQIIIELSVGFALSDGQIQINTDPLRRFAFELMNPNGTGEGQITDEDMADSRTGICDIQWLYEFYPATSHQLHSLFPFSFHHAARWLFMGPAHVLAAIQSNHLPGHRRRFQNEPDRIDYLSQIDISP